MHAKDKTGFIVNRLLVPYMLDAVRAFEEGVGSIEEIDTAMKAGANHPMGPLTLLDFVGLDTTKSIADIMFDEYRERRFAAPPTLRKMVAAGFYGRKSGRGFYDYSGDAARRRSTRGSRPTKREAAPAGEARSAAGVPLLPCDSPIVGRAISCDGLLAARRVACRRRPRPCTGSRGRSRSSGRARPGRGRRRSR